jgi:PST family polysaccharide transporter
MLVFGANLTGFNILNYFARNADNILIGKVWGSGPLGLYSKAYSLLMLPINQINSPLSAVTISALSRLQNNPSRYLNYYRKSLSFVSHVTTPLIFAMACLSNELIHLLLGERWAEASSIFFVLSLAAIGQPISNSLGWVLISSGQTRRQLYWGLISSPIIVTGFVLGLRWGAFGVAVSYAVTTQILRIPSWWFVLRDSTVSLWDVFDSIWRSFFASIVMVVMMILVQTRLDTIDSMLRFFVVFFIGLFAYLSVVGLWSRAREEAFGPLKGIVLPSKKPSDV